MRSYDASTLTYINARAGIVARHLLWVIAKNRSTGEAETMGLWNGEQEAEFTIRGETRTYIAAGAFLGFEEIRAGTGLDVQIHNFSLSGISSDVDQLIRGYDSRLARVEAHRALYDLNDNTLVAEPIRVLKGWVNHITFVTGENAGLSDVTMSVASASRALTRTLGAVRSHAAQQAAFPDDDFRKHVDISRAVGVRWGPKQP